MPPGPQSLLSNDRWARPSPGVRGGKKVAAHSKEERMLAALLITFEKHRLPRALKIKEQVDKGDLLSAWEIAFLQEAIDEASRSKALVDRHREFQALYAHAVRLYDEITVQALKNEQRADQDTGKK